MGHGEFLGNHATEADADHDARIPTDVIQQVDRVTGVLRHREWTPDDARLAETPLVVRKNGRELAQSVDDRCRTLERRARTIEEENTGARAREFVMQPHAGPENMPLYSVGFSIGGSFS